MKSWNFGEKVYFYPKITFLKKCEISIKNFKVIDETTKILIQSEK